MKQLSKALSWLETEMAIYSCDALEGQANDNKAFTREHQYHKSYISFSCTTGQLCDTCIMWVGDGWIILVGGCH